MYKQEKFCPGKNPKADALANWCDSQKLVSIVRYDFDEDTEQFTGKFIETYYSLIKYAE